MSADTAIGAGPTGHDRGRRSEAGFTLLEVIVAAAIAALALVALFQTSSTGLLTASEAARVAEAVDRAQSHLAAVGDAGTTPPGEIEADDGGGYRWRLTAHPVASPRPGPGGAATLYDIRVTVSWGGRRHTRSVELETRRIIGGGAQQ